MLKIDSTFFYGDIYLANQSEPHPNNRNASDLQTVIDNSIEEVLSYAFGRKMYNDFIQNQDNYQDLINGEEYTKDGKDFYWGGLVKYEPNKQSLIADYAYVKYSEMNVTQTTNFGEVMIDNKVGNKASSIPKITKAWNKFLKQYQGGTFAQGASGLTDEGNPFWIYPNRLGNGYWVDYSGGFCWSDGVVPLLKYLHDNKEKYPLLNNNNAWTKGFAYKNSFGI